MRISISAPTFRALHACAAVGDTRYYLCGYHFEPCDGATRGTSTDGHGLLQVSSIEGEAPETPIIVQALPKAPRAAADVVTLEVVDGEAPKRKVRLTQISKTGKTLDATLLDELDARYPDTAAVMPRDHDGRAPEPFALNPELLARVARHLGPIGRLSWPTNTSDRAAFQFDFHGRDDVIAIAMPTRWCGDAAPPQPSIIRSTSMTDTPNDQQLRAAGLDLTKALASFIELCVVSASPDAPAPAAATAANTLTLETLRPRFQALSEAGHRDKLVALLESHGCQKLPDVPAEKYPELDQALSELEAA